MIDNWKLHNLFNFFVLVRHQGSAPGLVRNPNALLLLLFRLDYCIGWLMHYRQTFGGQELFVRLLRTLSRVIHHLVPACLVIHAISRTRLLRLRYGGKTPWSKVRIICVATR